MSEDDVRVFLHWKGYFVDICGKSLSLSIKSLSLSVIGLYWEGENYIIGVG